MCWLILIGVNVQGEKRRLALADGYRASKASWLGIIRDLRARGLETPPQWVIGDGALGCWAALGAAWPQTRSPRCWVHKTANGLNELPKSVQGKAQAGLHAIGRAETKARAHKAFDRFARDFGAQYPQAVAILDQDRAAPLAFYDFPAEHGVPIRTTHLIESSFATIRHRTTRTQNCVSPNTWLGLVFQLALTAEQSWRQLGAFKRLPDVLKGVRFQDGIAVVDPPDAGEDKPQKIAA